MNSLDWDAMMDRARVLHPERFAPDGTPLMNVRQGGRTWAERLATWHRRNDPEPHVPDEDAPVSHPTPEIPL